MSSKVPPDIRSEYRSTANELYISWGDPTLAETIVFTEHPHIHLVVRTDKPTGEASEEEMLQSIDAEATLIELTDLLGGEFKRENHILAQSKMFEMGNRVFELGRRSGIKYGIEIVGIIIKNFIEFKVQ